MRPGDFIEFFAEIGLLGVLSTCPGGNCGSSQSDDSTPCFPLQVDVLRPAEVIGSEGSNLIRDRFQPRAVAVLR